MSFDVSSAAVQGGFFAFDDWLNKSLLAGYEPKSLIEVSSERSDEVTSSEGSLDMNLDDLVTPVDASEVYDTADVERWTSPLGSAK